MYLQFGIDFTQADLFEWKAKKMNQTGQGLANVAIDSKQPLAMGICTLILTKIFQKMRFRFLLLVLLVWCKCNAQITISQADMPGNNDTLRYSNAASPSSLQYQLSGPNQNWDFSTLQPLSQDVDAYKSSLLTPYAFFFLGINKYGKKVADSLGVGAFQFTDIYNFYRKTSSVFEVEGIGLRYQGIPLPAYYSDKDELFQFPLTYGRRDSSTFKFSISISTLISYSQVGYRINEVEGWGSITTPFGTFNCLKIKSTIQSADSLNLSGFSIKFNQSRIEYKWLANGIKIPVLEISGNVIGSNFIPSTVKYRDLKRSNVLLQPPVAQFSANPTLVPVFGNVQFTNTSLGNLVQYKWEFDPATAHNFENGTSDTSKNPTVSFLEPGVYSAKLRVSNFLGQDEELKSNYITVFDPTATSKNIQNPVLLYLDELAISIPKEFEEAEASLWNLKGEKIELKKVGNHFQTPENQLTNGVYFFRLQISNKSWSTRFISLK